MQAIHDFITRVLLRNFRTIKNASLSEPRLDRWEDLDLLRFHWAASRQMMELCEYLNHHRHEVQSTRGERIRTDDAMARGRIEARSTVIAKAISGHPARVVFAEPIRSYTTGPNHVLVWVLQRAHLLLSRFAEEVGAKSPYTTLVAAAVTSVSAARRITSVTQAIAESDYTQRPSPQSLGQAAGARKKLYRLAHAAYLLLQRIEAHDPTAIVEMLNGTLLAPLQDWQAFELALAFGMGSALAEVTGHPLRLQRISPGPSSAVIRVAGFSIHWQNQTSAYEYPEPEPSEILVDGILDAYGLTRSGDRPDIVVMNENENVVAIAEAKFFTNETEGWASALRGATTQLVRYGRGYSSNAALQRLLGLSVIGLWKFPHEERPRTTLTDKPIAVDFEDLTLGLLKDWALRLVAPAETAHPAL